jgi:AraC-like DNA-binding protein
MAPISRKAFIQMAVGLGATAVWGRSLPLSSGLYWRERRDLYPEGVASGDPDSHSVLLWTRYPSPRHSARKLTVEVAEDESFERVIAVAKAPVSEPSDWTCRVLAGGLKPAKAYWYRFTDAEGNGSRAGRTITAPADDDERPVRFVFVSCQNVNQGAQNAYRRMIFEDERASERDRIDFVLHLGDFIYELVWYPEDRPQGMYDRRLRDIVRYEHGEKIEDFHIHKPASQPPRLAGNWCIYCRRISTNISSVRRPSMAVNQAQSFSHVSVVHANPERNWTVGELAREAATSRSVLAQRFTELVGESPMRYLAGWRIQLAKQLLRDGTNIAEVSGQIGYESEAAFNRAFKRTTGSPPASWRRKVTALTAVLAILLSADNWLANLFAS